MTFNAAALDAPPAAITDLALQTAGTGAALTWTAAGEDGSSGTVYGGRYAIFYSTAAGSTPAVSAAQIFFSTTTVPGAAQAYPLPGLLGNAVYQLAVFMADAQGQYSAASNPLTTQTAVSAPAGIENVIAGTASLNIGWQAANNNTPIEYGLRIDTDAFEPAVGVSPFKDRTDRSFVFTGLTPDTTYWMYGSARNPESGAMSAWVNLGSTATLAARPGALLGSVVGVSSCSIAWDSGGNPAWTQYQAQISTTPDWTSISGESGWVKRTDYVFNGLVSGAAYYLRAKARNTGGVETGYTDLGVLKTASVDLLPPVTQIVAGTPAYRTEGELFITSTTILNLSAFDDAFAAGDKLGVVAAVYYSVDPDTFSVYAGTFTIAGEGGHRARFYSVDAAGNAEAVKTSSITVDNSAPVSSAAISGVFQDGYYTGPVTVTLTALDAISGVAETDYALDGGGFAVYVSSFVVETNGLHSLVFRSKDRLGNQENDKTVPIDLHIVVSSAPAEITPSSGPIGLPFVITGAGFGGYKANLTTVLIGGTTAPITSWSTTTIKGTVPGALPPGEYPVSVTRGTTTITEGQPFTVTLPVIYALTPSSGPIGMPFVLAGASFGNYKAGYTRVLIGGATAQITSWTDLTIKAKAPGSVPSGDHALLIERELNGGIARSNVSTFSILTPEITAVTPSTGSIGAPFTISGLNFGNYLANYTRVLIGVTTVTISSWHDTSIKALVPGKLSSGDYELAIEREQAGWIVRSSTAALTVADPEMGIITPSSGPIGLPFTITGTGFGNYKAGYTRVLLGDTTAPITSWTDTAIKGTVPGSLTAGEYETAVEREMNGGFIRSSTVTFTVTMPYISTVTPISGPIGLPVVITGNSFGNYKAGYTRVLIGGTTAPVTSWTDQTIKATVPGGLATG
ncbi:MAG: IPT/TIG domain-containing protein, partial [Elusimicrobiales bacterium]